MNYKQVLFFSVIGILALVVARQSKAVDLSIASNSEILEELGRRLGSGRLPHKYC